MIPSGEKSPAELVAGIGPETTVVTPTQRLSRELHNRYQVMQVELGRSAWQTPDIIPFDPWLKRLWREPDISRGSRILLNGLQQSKIWSNIIEKDLAVTAPDTAPLWNVPASTNKAIQAWRLIHQWSIPLEECASSWLEDHRRFAEWATRYRQQCLESHWLDDACLADALPDNGAPEENLPHNLILTGFDLLTPQQARLFKCFESAGCNVEMVQLVLNNNPDVDYRRYLDSSAQWLAAAHWARDIVSAAPDSRVGIIVPGLEAIKGIVEHAFAQVLDPLGLFNADEADTVFHLSLGKPLSEYPVVDAACKLLSLVSEERIRASVLGDLLTSPFISGALSEKAARATLESQCRKSLPWEIPALRIEVELQAIGAYESTPRLREIIHGVVALKPAPSAKHSYGQWADLIAQALATFGWPGESNPVSDEFQAMEAFREQLGQIRSLDLVSGPTTLAGALSELQTRLRQQPFQPETPSAPVEILGVVESAGLEFDALWFGNQVTGNWPPDSVINPFIPRNAQAQAGIPAADHQANLKYYSEVARRRVQLCGESVFSRQQADGDIKLLAGALFNDPPATSTSPPSLVEQLMDDGSEMEVLQDFHGAPFPRKEAPGGAGLVTSQSACPYQAYAKYRLGAGYVDFRDPGMDAPDRGSLLHEVLEKVWQELEDSNRLREMSHERCRELIAGAARSAVNQFTRSHNLGTGYADSLFAWLTRLVEQWLELENRREQGFSVLATEHEVGLELEGLRLAFRVDRVDRLANNKLVLIDYKSGHTPGVARWIGDPPDYRSEYPQLGLYALAAESSDDPLLQGEIEALLVATLKLGAERFAGFSLDSPVFSSDSDVSKAPAILDKTRNIEESLRHWPALLQQWKSSFRDRVVEFQEGFAKVDPLRGACDHCDLQTLCRIHESGQVLTDD